MLVELLRQPDIAAQGTSISARRSAADTMTPPQVTLSSSVTSSLCCRQFAHTVNAALARVDHRHTDPTVCAANLATANAIRYERADGHQQNVVVQTSAGAAALSRRSKAEISSTPRWGTVTVGPSSTSLTSPSSSRNRVASLGAAADAGRY